MAFLSEFAVSHKGDIQFQRLANVLVLKLSQHLQGFLAKFNHLLFGICNTALLFGECYNLFNFLVLCIVDMLCLHSDIYDFSDSKVENLLTFGTVATLATLYMLQSNKRVTKILCIFGAVACYIAFLMVD